MALLEDQEEDGARRSSTSRLMVSPGTAISPMQQDQQISTADKVNGFTDRFITLNVGGMKYQTRLSTLRRFPDTLLGSDELEEYWVPESQEYFFDRSRTAFEPILYYYQSSGIVCLPSYINPDVFCEELRFFKMDRKILDKFNSPHHLMQAAGTLRAGKFWHPIQEQAWQLFDDPNSGSLAKFIGYFDQVVILLAVAAQCIESLPVIRRSESDDDVVVGHISVSAANQALFLTEVISIGWFTLIFMIRFFCCPSKREFVKSVLNWLDLLAILPFYMDLVLQNSKPFLAILRFFRTIRIVRIFKISRYFQGLFALGHSVSTSAGELLLLSLMLATFVVLFSSLVFFTENCDDQTEGIVCDGNNQFDSVVAGFWWSIVTMSTVGYGDYVPKTPLGKVVGSLCALTGILVISLPFPLIITNFNKFMRLRHSKSRTYATIADGLGDDMPYHIPEFTGVAYGFFDDTDVTPSLINSDVQKKSNSVV